MKLLNQILLAALLWCICGTARAQMYQQMAAEPYRIDTTDTRILKVKVDAMAFFHDNEYDSKMTRGYTLPGLWITPKLTYNPLSSIHLELGARALIFYGANKYPSYAYHDIGTWKGNQYQRGIHVLPWFRASARVRNLTFVLGDLYGCASHRLITPMYNDEHALSADPEMGFQMILDRRHIHMDTWIDWQSYIFEEDTHQEAFTVGANATLLWNSHDARTHLYSPIQLLIQHRGGEQVSTPMGVQTLSNVAAGLGLRHEFEGRAITRMESEVDALGCYQQKGGLWPFDAGWGIHATTVAILLKRLEARVGYMYMPHNYQSLYGNPFFSTHSVRNTSVQYDGMHTTYARLNYTHTFATNYHLGAQVEAFQLNNKEIAETNFSFGVYIRITPDFLIKRW